MSESITVRKLPDGTKDALQQQAEQDGFVSLEPWLRREIIRRAQGVASPAIAAQSAPVKPVPPPVKPVPPPVADTNEITLLHQQIERLKQSNETKHQALDAMHRRAIQAEMHLEVEQNKVAKLQKELARIKDKTPTSAT
jgi:uncharacterized small protein (DUF1192 family)